MSMNDVVLFFIRIDILKSMQLQVWPALQDFFVTQNNVYTLEKNAG
jgi:hypothetical protein